MPGRLGRARCVWVSQSIPSAAALTLYQAHTLESSRLDTTHTDLDSDSLAQSSFPTLFCLSLSHPGPFLSQVSHPPGVPSRGANGGGKLGPTREPNHNTKPLLTRWVWPLKFSARERVFRQGSVIWLSGRVTSVFLDLSF